MGTASIEFFVRQNNGVLLLLMQHLLPSSCPGLDAWTDGQTEEAIIDLVPYSN